jgi:hypothetical protein
MLQQLVAEPCFWTSSKVSFVRPLLVLGLGVAVFDALGDGLAEALGVALAVVFTALPLFQISLLPDLTQKYFTPPVVLVVPTLVHLVPAIVAA